MPISLLALLGMAIFVWMERGDFSTREVSLSIEGPSQIENGKTEKFIEFGSLRKSNKVSEYNVGLNQTLV